MVVEDHREDDDLEAAPTRADGYQALANEAVGSVSLVVGLR